MPMTLATNQVALGDHLYLLKSPQATTDCILFGHAGLATKLNLPQFQVPAGTTLHFYVPHGQAHRTAPTLPLDWKGKAEHDVAAGGWSYNYVVIKGVGEHWHGDFPKTYQAIRRAMDAGRSAAAQGGWRPHYVTVRNRRGIFRGKGYVTLKEMIETVLAFSKQAASGIQPITDFYFAGCRGIENDWTPS